jgi:hypothetical protein
MIIIYYKNLKNKHYIIIYKIQLSMAPNWDDEFDFDDIDAKPKAKPNNKKNQKVEDDFFDDDAPVKSK